MITFSKIQRSFTLVYEMIVLMHTRQKIQSFLFYLHKTKHIRKGLYKQVEHTPTYVYHSICIG